MSSNHKTCSLASVWFYVEQAGLYARKQSQPGVFATFVGTKVEGVALNGYVLLIVQKDK